MDGYSLEQVAVIQLFVDCYRGAPESFTMGTGFVRPILDSSQRAAVEELVTRGIFEKKVVGAGLAGTAFYRPSASFTDLAQLVRDEQIRLR